MKNIKSLIKCFIVFALTVLSILSLTYSIKAKENKVQAQTNIALGKKVSTTSPNNESFITDGNLDTYWEGEPYPALLEVDLGDFYNVTSLKLYCFADGGRYYNYKIFYSANKRDYALFGQKNDTVAVSSSGENYNAPNGSVVARYIRVDITYNSANTGVHVREIEVFGTKNTTYKDVIPSVDPTDNQNVAYLKQVKSNMNFIDPSCVTNGSLNCYWRAKFAPAYLDVDLEQNYDLTGIKLLFPERDNWYYYIIYGSVDGDNFDRLYTKHNTDLPSANGDEISVSGTYRFIRVYLQYKNESNTVSLSEIKVYGSATGQNRGLLRTGSIENVLDVKDYANTEFANEITENETIENVYGIIERTVGKLYKKWFSFELKQGESGLDYYELSDKNGKILIKGNNGISLASGVNYYFKHYCNVNITEQANQTLMPTEIVKINGTVFNQTPYEIRYAFNYCTMDYSFAFFTEKDFQKEYDYLALNGVNLALDLTGQEAVWIKFLMNFGYTYDEAKSWLCGPAYYAWQFMDNMEIYGGCVTDGWVKERLESARRMQRWRTSLGMQTCLQGYVGMVPNNFKNYQPDVDILEQGTWCGLDRPDMIRTDTTLYDDYARLFYQAQEWAFGKNSNYYACDPFHEGGIRPNDLADDIISREIIKSIVEYNSNGVWVIQAWHSNPTNLLLKGLEGYREEHALILDLCGLEAPKWNRTTYGEDGEGGTTLENIEFNYTPWVWCMLDNYGGNPSMDGELQNIIDQLELVNKTATKIKGIGIIAEATLDNPIIYNLCFDMAWGTYELESWEKDYITARYGRYSEKAFEGWKLLNETVYNKNNGWYRTVPWVLTHIPEWKGIDGIPYDMAKLEKALTLLLADYDVLCGSEGYRYDIVEIMQHIVNHYAVNAYNQLYSAFQSKNKTDYYNAKAKFMNSFEVMNKVLECRSEWLVGEWIGKAEDWSELLQNDFAYDSLVDNAKALITSWAHQLSLRAIPDYAQRHYEGMLIDLYKARWEVFLNKLEANLESGTAIVGLNLDDYYHVYRKWALNDKQYLRVPNESYANIYAVASRVVSECFVSSNVLNKNALSLVVIQEGLNHINAVEESLYNQEQLSFIYEVKTCLNNITLSSSLTEYYDAVKLIYDAYDVIANPLKDTAQEGSSGGGTGSSGDTSSSGVTSSDATSSGDTSSSGVTSSDAISSGDTSSSGATSSDATSSGDTSSSGVTSSDVTSSGEETSSSSTQNSSSSSASNGSLNSSSKNNNGKGCKASLSNGSILSLLALTAIVALKRKNKKD